MYIYDLIECILSYHPEYNFYIKHSSYDGFWKCPTCGVHISQSIEHCKYIHTRWGESFQFDRVGNPIREQYIMGQNGCVMMYSPQVHTKSEYVIMRKV